MVIKKTSIFKQALSLILALVLVIGILPAVQTSAETTEVTVGEYEVVLSEDETAYFSFTPEESATYYIYTYGDYDTYLACYSSGEEEYWSDDDSGLDANASLEAYLEEGITYTISAWILSGDAGEFTLVISTEEDPNNDDNYDYDDDYYFYEEPDFSSLESGAVAITELDTAYSASLSGTEVVYAYYSFTAPEENTYAFYSDGDYDTYIYVYDSEGNLIGNNDDAGSNLNSYYQVALSEGETVYLAFCLYSYTSATTAEFDVYVSEADPSYLGDGIYYSYEDGVLSFWATTEGSYISTYYFYYIQDLEDWLYSIADSVTEIVIGDNIVEISSYFLDLFENLEKVTIEGNASYTYEYENTYEDGGYEYYYYYSCSYSLYTTSEGALYYSYSYTEIYNGETYTGSYEYLLWTPVTLYTELYGATRYDTMEEIVAETCSYAYTAIITTGTNFPDALAAASLAGVYWAPIILVSDGTADDAVELLENLGVERAYIVGGENSVSSSTVAKIEKAGIETTRISGDTRQETALEVAEAVYEYTWSNTCIVAAGASYADALSISPYSYWSSSPIFLANNNGSVSQDVLDAIVEQGYSRIVVVGGENSVSASAYESLEALGTEIIRLGGATRYETSQLIAEWSVAQGMSYEGAAVASGTNFADALSGAQLCGQNGSVMLLATDNSYAAVDLLAGQDIDELYFIGGTSSLSTTVRSYVKSLLD